MHHAFLKNTSLLWLASIITDSLHMSCKRLSKQIAKLLGCKPAQLKMLLFGVTIL